jgi:uncharacterized alpha-E superfamily protein
VIKPVSRRIVRTSRFGWELSASQREELARWISADPHGWVAQEALLPSTTPGIGARGLEAQPLVLRSFATADGSSYRILPGGLIRVATDAGASVVLTQEGALAKDVWVLSSAPVTAEDIAAPDFVPSGQVVSAISPRVAEDLFWLGRYAERVEDISRLVAVTDNRWHDVHPGADPAVHDCVDVLLNALLSITVGWAAPSADEQTGPQRQLLSLIGDGRRIGTLAHDVRRIRELANTNRDQLSTDTWAVLSDLERGLAPFLGGGGSGPVTTAMTTLREALLAFAGLAAESMVRDSGWHFMDAGRRIERGVQLSRLLRSTLVARQRAAVEDLVEESTLIAAESIITHRRRYPAHSGVETLLELLLLDRDNPRSVAYQLERLAADLRRIAPPGATSDQLDDRVLHISARLLAADCTALARSEDGQRVGLGYLLDDIVLELHELAASIERTHFAHLGTLQQLVPIAGFESLESV